MGGGTGSIFKDVRLVQNTTIRNTEDRFSVSQDTRLFDGVITGTGIIWSGQPCVWVTETRRQG